VATGTKVVLGDGTWPFGSGEAAMRRERVGSGEAGGGMARARAVFAAIFIVVIAALALLCASS
jgi:hypothetical protein